MNICYFDVCKADLPSMMTSLQMSWFVIAIMCKEEEKTKEDKIEINIQSFPDFLNTCNQKYGQKVHFSNKDSKHCLKTKSLSKHD